MTLAKMAISFAVFWGLVCGVFERLVLAPRRQLALVSPAYVPGMIFAFIAGVVFLFDGLKMGDARLFLAPVMAVAFFVVGAVPAIVMFRLSRWILRTRSV